MKATKITSLVQIVNCEICDGKGYTGWTSPEGDFDFEYCECNPDSIIIDEGGEVTII